MRIVTYSHDIISLLDSEFIAASLQDGLFTFTRPNGQVVEVKLPTRAEIEKLSQSSSVSEGSDVQTSPVSISCRPSRSENTPPKAESSTSQVVDTNLPSIASAPESKHKIGLFRNAPAPDSAARNSDIKPGNIFPTYTSAPESKHIIGLFQTAPGPNPTDQELPIKQGSVLHSSGSSSLFAPPVSTSRTQKPNDQVAGLVQDMGTNKTKTSPARSVAGRNAEKGSSGAVNVTSPSCSSHSSNIPSLGPVNPQPSKNGGNGESELYLCQLEDLKVRVAELQSMWNEADVKGIDQKVESLKKRLDVVKEDVEKWILPAITEVQDRIDGNLHVVEDIENKMYENFENVQEDYEHLEAKVNELLGRQDGKNSRTRQKKH